MRRSQTVFIAWPGRFFGLYWPRFHTPQILFIQSLFDQLNVKMHEGKHLVCINSSIELQFDGVFPRNDKLFSPRMLSAILNDYLLHVPIRALIATDTTQSEEKCGIGIFSPTLDWSFSLRLPVVVAIFLAELLAVVLAFCKLPTSVSSSLIVTDSLPVCSFLTNSHDCQPLVALKSLLPSHINLVRLLRAADHEEFYLNEMGDALAKAAVNGPVVQSLPALKLIIGAIFKRQMMLRDFIRQTLMNS